MCNRVEASYIVGAINRSGNQFVRNKIFSNDRLNARAASTRTSRLCLALSQVYIHYIYTYSSFFLCTYINTFIYMYCAI